MSNLDSDVSSSGDEFPAVDLKKTPTTVEKTIAPAEFSRVWDTSTNYRLDSSAFEGCPLQFSFCTSGAM